MAGPPRGASRRTSADDPRGPRGNADAGGGWVLLGERAPREVALGLVGRFWQPVIDFSDVEASGFRDFAEPGFAKTIYALSTRSIDPARTLLRATMRTATTDEHARVWFRRYWTIGVEAGAHVLAGAFIELVAENAQRGS